jgi:hypothetical protein
MPGYKGENRTIAIIKTSMSTISSPDEKQTFPWFVFGLMASVTFVGILSELVPSGILPQMTEGLGIEASEVGFLVGVYALASAIAAIPLISATLAFNRKKTDSVTDSWNDIHSQRSLDLRPILGHSRDADIEQIASEFGRDHSFAPPGKPQCAAGTGGHGNPPGGQPHR